MKISFIMQVYLGDYPGSRSNAVDKFHRAVNSVLRQDVDNYELVIVSDGCKKTKELYYEHYDNNPNVVFAYVDKPADLIMYRNTDGKKYYRGIPRQVGRAIATGDWIAYMDADDFLIKDATLKLENYLTKVVEYNKVTGKEIKFLFNTSIIEHENYAALIQMQIKKYGLKTGVSTILSDTFKIDGLEGNWFNRGTYETFMMSTASMVHTNDFPKVKWKDIESDNTSEDVEFANDVLSDPELKKYVNLMEIPYYVRCHYDKLWDV